MLLLLIFSSYFDIQYFKVLNGLTKYSIFFLIVLNIGALFIFTNQNDILLFNNLDFRPLDNLVAGFFSWFVTLSIVKLSNDKGMGEGDIRIATIIGLSFGISKVILAMYIAIFSAILFGLFAMVQKRNNTYLRLKLPFVPFLVFGAVVSLYLTINANDIFIFIENLLFS